ncbi:MAG: LPS export ABC transporter periplasmic protein LptC [Candidatus Omnitrophica bacterium]|nr:LPS export ABC transporter periplasmic protein LptC [Candidatus Omnitrophota bacterium]
MLNKRALIIASGLLLAAGCSAPAKPASRADTDVRDGVEQQVSTFTVAGYQAGERKKWEVQGASADIMGQQIAMTKVVGTAYGDQETGSITAEQGTMNRESQDIHLEQNVVATTSDGAILKTDQLDWDAQASRVTTDAPVWIARENIESTGRGAEAQPNLKRVSLREDVTVKVHDGPVTAPIHRADPAGGALATFVGPSKQAAAPMTITCNGPLNVDYERNVAVFQDHVHVRDARGEVFADIMDVHFDPATHAVKRVVAYGQVRIIRGPNTAKSERAIYEPARGTVTLSGQPRLDIVPGSEGGAPAMPATAGEP